MLSAFCAATFILGVLNVALAQQFNSDFGLKCDSIVNIPDEHPLDEYYIRQVDECINIDRPNSRFHESNIVKLHLGKSRALLESGNYQGSLESAFLADRLFEESELRGYVDRSSIKIRIALAKSQMGDHFEALNTALEAREMAFNEAAGRSSSLHASIHEMNGIILENAGFLAPAIRSYLVQIDVLRRNGDHDVRTAKSLMKIGDALLKINMSHAAANVYEIATRLPIASDPGRSLSRADLFHALGVALRLSGQPQKSLEKLEAARALRFEALGPENSLTLKTQMEVALSYLESDQIHRSADLLNHLHRLDDPPEDREGRKPSYYIGRILQESGRHEEAIEYLSYARDNEGPYHWRNGEISFRIAKSLFALGRYRECTKQLNSIPAGVEDNLNDPFFRPDIDWTSVFFMRMEIALRSRDKDRLFYESSIVNGFWEYQGGRMNPMDAAVRSANSTVIPHLFNETTTKLFPYGRARYEENERYRYAQRIESFRYSDEDIHINELKDVFSVLSGIDLFVEDQAMRAYDFNKDSETPDYAESLELRSYGVEEARNIIGEDEVLLVVSAHGKSGHVLAIGKRESVVGRIDFPSSIPEVTKGFRCMLSAGREEACPSMRRVTGVPGVSVRGVVQFSETKSREIDIVSTARNIYGYIFEETIGKFINGKRIVIIPSVHIIDMPWALLVNKYSEPVDVENLRNSYKEAAWLFIDNPSIKVVPTISAFMNLRGRPYFRPQELRYIGIGDPSLSGYSDSPACGSGSRAGRSGEITATTAARIRNAVESGRVSELPALPDTRCEVFAVSKAVERVGGHADKLLGPDATKENLFSLNREKQLIGYNIVHFATHGIVGGSVGEVENGLILSPTEDSTRGAILSETDIDDLRIDAHLVILSACNTSAASSELLSPLSGLPLSFFAAGARSALVSLWPVDSDVASELVSETVSNMLSDPNIDHAEALSMAMRKLLLSSTNEYEAAPARWGAFAIIGDARPGLFVTSPRISSAGRAGRVRSGKTSRVGRSAYP